MSFALHHNEPSPINTSYCGSFINALREKSVVVESKQTDGAPVFNKERFMFVTGMLFVGFGAGLEGTSRLATSALMLIPYAAFPWCFKNKIQENLKTSLVCFRIFFAATNPYTCLSLLALGALPKSQKAEFSEEKILMLKKFEEHGKHLTLGSFAKIKGSDSIFDMTLAGSCINAIREQQTNLENEKVRTTKELILSRLFTTTAYLACGIASGVEGVGYLMAMIALGSYLTSMSNDKLRELFKIDAEEITKKKETLKEMASKFFVSTLLFSQAINPGSLLINALDHMHADTYKVPADTAKVLNDLALENAENPLL